MPNLCSHRCNRTARFCQAFRPALHLIPASPRRSHLQMILPCLALPPARVRARVRVKAKMGRVKARANPTLLPRQLPHSHRRSLVSTLSTPTVPQFYNRSSALPTTLPTELAHGGISVSIPTSSSEFRRHLRPQLQHRHPKHAHLHHQKPTVKLNLINVQRCHAHILPSLASAPLSLDAITPTREKYREALQLRSQHPQLQ